MREHSTDSRLARGAGLHVAGNNIFAQAQQYHQGGQLHEARALYRKILETQPDYPDVMHMLGVLEHQLDNHATAINLIKKSPDAPTHCSVK